MKASFECLPSITCVDRDPTIGSIMKMVVATVGEGDAADGEMIDVPLFRFVEQWVDQACRITGDFDTIGKVVHRRNRELDCPRDE